MKESLLKIVTFLYAIAVVSFAIFFLLLTFHYFDKWYVIFQNVMVILVLGILVGVIVIIRCLMFVLKK